MLSKQSLASVMQNDCCKWERAHRHLIWQGSLPWQTSNSPLKDWFPLRTTSRWLHSIRYPQD